MLWLNCVFDHAQDVIQSDSESRKTSPTPQSLTWPYEVPTTFAFLSWQMWMVGCLTVASLSALALCSRPRGRWRGDFLLLLPPSKPNHKLPHVWCPPLTLLTSEADPRPAGHSPKPHTVTTQPPPVAATLLPLTYHPKHYHKLLPCCQAAHTAELTVRLCTASLCKDSSVWGKKVELVKRGKRSRLRWHFTRDIKPTVVFYVLWLVVIACGTDSAARCNSYCAVFEADEKCVRQCVNLFETWHKSACCPSFSCLTSRAISLHLSLCENWGINRGLIEKTTHTWCYGNNGLSLFVCISEEQAQIINECFASSVQPQLSQWVNKVGQTNHYVHVCVCVCVWEREREREKKRERLRVHVSACPRKVKKKVDM